ncbi:PREDICTED: thioredoxin, mitochondrial isoform X1 [Papilio xuthus]|uniref:Thioredoxin, mitochondrial isoform X1 n=1 Tax=Papilio xuthus TaxID=66420 RepID=A0AAJ6YZA6_PAPXU|nr:PREDICTED: thioredoxin, mitochondrial isoform X1 [Papilio xuthus]
MLDFCENWSLHRQDKMNNAISKGLRSPMRSLANLRRAKAISTSIVHNETILVKNNEEFVNKVMNNEKPVIVNFHAEWCEPCKILTPKLKELIEPLDNLDLAIVDVEENADLVHTFEVKAVPAVIAVKNGLIVDKFIGLVDADMITNLIDKMSGKKTNS